ncbi:MAG: hypothetical protein HXY25_01205 [Alphaproteobacteria bacterium]|nr:hypothetical protein [Alphaproteobacteria bacterium]
MAAGETEFSKRMSERVSRDQRTAFRDLNDLFERGEVAKQYLMPAKNEEAVRAGKLGLIPDRSQIEGFIAHTNNDIALKVVSLQGYRKDLDSRLPPANKYWLVRLQNLVPLIVSAAVLMLALTVDYAIVNEFWTKVLSDEFGEIPKSLEDGIFDQSTVFWKSAQVVFAVLALHFFMRYWGRAGRMAFAGILFALVILVSIGLGLLISSDSLPAGASFGGVEIGKETLSVDDALAELGLESGTADVSEDEAARAASVQNRVASAETTVFLATLSLIFFLVAGVGAFALHFLLNAFAAIIGSPPADGDSRGLERLPLLWSKRLVEEEVASYMASAQGRWNLLRAYVARYQEDFAAGLAEFRPQVPKELASVRIRMDVPGAVDADGNEAVLTRPAGIEDLRRAMSAELGRVVHDLMHESGDWSVERVRELVREERVREDQTGATDAQDADPIADDDNVTPFWPRDRGTGT